jgi:signal transduction histidine kinase
VNEIHKYNRLIQSLGSIKSWLTERVRNKITFSVLLVFLIIYGITVSLNYFQMKIDLFDAAEKEALSTAQMIAISIYRNFEIPADFREIQSYVIGTKRFKKNIIELNVIDNELTVIGNATEDKLLRKVTGTDFIEAVRYKKRHTHLNEEADNPYIRIVYPIAAGISQKHIARGCIELVISLKPLINHLSRIRNNTIISGIIIIFAIITIIVLLSGSIMKPIDDLYSGIKKVNRGDLDVQIDVRSRDEIGFLTSSFNRMIVSVKESKQKLEEYAANLEYLKNFQDDIQLINPSNLTPVNIPPAREIANVASSLNSVIDNLREAFERERRFISNVAHELRTPISELRTLAEVSLKWPEDIDEQNLQNYRDILSAVKHMQNTVSNLLVLSRLDSGSLQSQKEMFELRPLAVSACRRYAEMADIKKIILNNTIPSHLSLFTDKHMFLLIVDNLLSNAVEYSRSSGTVDLSARHDGDFFLLSVSNPVEDLSPNDLPFIFERFWRKDKARTSDRSHSGLGLSLVKSLADFLGFTVEAEISHTNCLNVSVSGKG